ncbi:hypothetical protein B1H19_00135 [Streptomyces gilvosporeus]|uniref:Uncharacterized protein n=1 Tax=Streptomyces gilvosporeus TaxID=553510 RepID=A0A1V0TIR8_9ACTN|nr:hypothetical protein B1H19_00135 [Streptomyces gilvosporeus]
MIGRTQAVLSTFTGHPLRPGAHLPPSSPGPGGPPGSKNRHRATRHDVGRVLATGQSHGYLG